MNTRDAVLGPLNWSARLGEGDGFRRWKQKHTEYYALIGGKRDTVHREGGTPCISSDGLEAETVRYIRYLYDAFDLPSVDNLALDGLGICQCEKCAGKTASDLGVGFADRVASRFCKVIQRSAFTVALITSYQSPPASTAKLSQIWPCGFPTPGDLS